LLQQEWEKLRPLWLGIGNGNKGFFTLPLRVSINAIYERIKDRDKIKI
jgi:CRISPR/Cas system-associated endonuclease/helicase Cas3